MSFLISVKQKTGKTLPEVQDAWMRARKLAAKTTKKGTPKFFRLALSIMYKEFGISDTAMNPKVLSKPPVPPAITTAVSHAKAPVPVNMAPVMLPGIPVDKPLPKISKRKAQ